MGPKAIFAVKTHGAPRLIPASNRTRSLSSAALSGSHTNIQDPGFRPAEAWQRPDSTLGF